MRASVCVQGSVPWQFNQRQVPTSQHQVCIEVSGKVALAAMVREGGGEPVSRISGYLCLAFDPASARKPLKLAEQSQRCADLKRAPCGPHAGPMRDHTVVECDLVGEDEHTQRRGRPSAPGGREGHAASVFRRTPPRSSDGSERVSSRSDARDPRASAARRAAHRSAR